MFFYCCCCCCCCVASVVSDSVRPHRQQPTRVHRPWDSPGKNTGVGCRFLLQCMKVKSESEVAQSCLTLRPHGLQPTKLLCPWGLLKPFIVWITTNWKILQELGIPEHLTCLLRNLYAGQEATVRTRHGTMDWFQTGKGVRQDYDLSTCLFSLYAEYIMKNIS